MTTSQETNTTMPASHARPDLDQGFTLIEVLVVCVLFSILSAFAVSGMAAWSRAQQQTGTQRELLSSLRYAQERAVTEDTTYCVEFTAASGSWSVYRTPSIPAGTASCAAYSQAVRAKGPLKTQGSIVSIANPHFAQRDGSDQPYALFFPSGSATPGSVAVSRDSAHRTTTVSVEGLTSRVSSDG